MLTPQQLQNLKVVNSPQGQASNALTPEQAIASFSATPNTASRYEIAMGIKNSDGTPNTKLGIIPAAINQAKNDITSTDNRSALSKGIAATSDIFSIPGELPGIKQLGQLFGTGINFTGEQLSKLYSPEFQKELGQMSTEDFAKATQPLQDFVNLGNIANSILLAKGVQDSTPKVKETFNTVTEKVPQIAEKVKNNVFGTPEEQAAAETAKIAEQQAEGAKVIDSTMRDLSSKYVGATDVLQQAEKQNGTNPIGVFQMYGKDALPTLENGKINSGEAVDFLKKQIGELSNLKNDAVFLNDNVVPPEEFKSQAIDTVKAEGGRMGWTQAKINSNIADVSKIVDELNTAYPDGIPINELDKIKTEQTGLSKTYKNPNAKFSYDAHGVVGKTARSLVETFTNDAPTKELNKLIQSHYDAIDLLDSLQGKSPKGGVMSKLIGRLTGEVVGSMAGATVGHPIIGALAGRVGADAISNALGSDLISNPLKRMMVESMNGVTPDVKAAMLKYIDENSPHISELGNQSLVPKNEPNTQNAISTSKTAPKTSNISPNSTTTPPKVKGITAKEKSVPSLKGQGATPETSLIKEAKKYKSAEEFVAKIRGSATQYGDYTPQLRQYGMEDYKNISELGTNPDKMVTIYRGIDTTTGKIKKQINDGDFVTTDFESAASYAGDKNVVSMKVPAKTLYTDTPEDFKNDPFYTGSEYVYTKQKPTPMSKSQLTDIWKKANKK